MLSAAFTLLSAGAANGLYTIGGILLTLVTPGLAAVGALGDVDHVAGRGGDDRRRDLQLCARHGRFDGRAVPAVSCLGRVDGRSLEAGVRRVIVLGGLG